MSRPHTQSRTWACPSTCSQPASSPAGDGGIPNWICDKVSSSSGTKLKAAAWTSGIRTLGITLLDASKAGLSDADLVSRRVGHQNVRAGDSPANLGGVGMDSRTHTDRIICGKIDYYRRQTSASRRSENYCLESSWDDDKAINRSVQSHY